MIKYIPKDGWCVGKGWHSLIEECIKELNVICECENYEIIDIKEKLGSLRISLSSNDKSILKECYKIIYKYEDISKNVCEECGCSGKIRSDLDRTSTLCEEHYKERLKEEEV